MIVMLVVGFLAMCVMTSILLRERRELRLRLEKMEGLAESANGSWRACIGKLEAEEQRADELRQRVAAIYGDLIGRLEEAGRNLWDVEESFDE